MQFTSFKPTNVSVVPKPEETRNLVFLMEQFSLSTHFANFKLMLITQMLKTTFISKQKQGFFKLKDTSWLCTDHSTIALCICLRYEAQLFFLAMFFETDPRGQFAGVLTLAQKKIKAASSN